MYEALEFFPQTLGKHGVHSASCIHVHRCREKRLIKSTTVYRLKQNIYYWFIVSLLQPKRLTYTVINTIDKNTQIGIKINY